MTNRNWFSTIYIKEIIFNEGLKHIFDNAFEGVAVEAIALPESLITIGDYAFKNCTNLSDINFNSGLYEIGEKAFIGTQLKNVKVPDGCKIYNYTFPKDCEVEYEKEKQKQKQEKDKKPKMYAKVIKGNKVGYIDASGKQQLKIVEDVTFSSNKRNSGQDR